MLFEQCPKCWRRYVQYVVPPVLLFAQSALKNTGHIEETHHAVSALHNVPVTSSSVNLIDNAQRAQQQTEC
jgi:hypothetical protein